MKWWRVARIWRGGVKSSMSGWLRGEEGCADLEGKGGMGGVEE